MNIKSLGGDPSVYKECGYCKDKTTKEVLTITTDIWTIISWLLQKYPSLEWGAVLEIEDSIVKSISIPKQEVTGTSVTFKEDIKGNGTIHSHNNMGAFWSGQDDSQFRNLSEYSIVINNKWEYQACRRIKLPCGGFGYKELVLEIEEPIDVEGLIVEKKPEITISKPYNYISEDYKRWWDDVDDRPTKTDTKIEEPKEKTEKTEKKDKTEKREKKETKDRRELNYDLDELDMDEMLLEYLDSVCESCIEKFCDTCKVEEIRADLWRSGRW